VLANLYVFCFGVSWGPVVWVLLGEMFPNQYRAVALSVAASIQWIANFVITVSFPVLLAKLGLSLSYAVYAAFAVLSLVFVARSVRETKGRTLEQM
jgi:MFS family permease